MITVSTYMCCLCLAQDGADADDGKASVWGDEEDSNQRFRTCTALVPIMPKSIALPMTTLIGLSPLLTMVIFISGIHNVFAAMLVMHWLCMITIPLLYLFFSPAPSLKYYVAFWNAQKDHIQRQLRWAIPSFFVAVVFVFSCYLLMKCNSWNSSFCPSMKQKALEEGFRIPELRLVAFGIYFAVVNPIVEEFFWRVFLFRELGGHFFLLNSSKSDSKCLPLPGDNPPLHPRETTTLLDAADNLRNFGIAATTTVPQTNQGGEEQPSLLTHSSLGVGTFPKEVSTFDDLHISALGQVVMSMMYASYHVVVLKHLLGGVYAFIVFWVLTFVGVVFIFARNSLSLGIISAVFMHGGVDLGATLAYANVFYHFF
eukprot:GHVT01032875.1.p1 GENE.GHVT01032875.1~~GHVT01032875.1.p1  ORF type:complete len:370 (+),score=8.66 GHVT01032875.1:208-1317(+)